MSHPVLTFFETDAAILVVGSSEDANGAVCPEAKGILESSTSAPTLAQAIERQLANSRDRMDNRKPATRSDEAELAIARGLALGKWREVLESTRRAALYEYADEEFDIAPLGFVDGDDVMLSQQVVSLKSPSLQELAGAVLAALELSEIR